MLEVARKRFAKRGWTNVHVLCQDASEFTLPEWNSEKDPKGSVGFVTLSYSLSMVSRRPFLKSTNTNRSTLDTELLRFTRPYRPRLVHRRRPPQRR
jgi:hypothetical protein